MWRSFAVAVERLSVYLHKSSLMTAEAVRLNFKLDVNVLVSVLLLYMADSKCWVTELVKIIYSLF